MHQLKLKPIWEHTRLESSEIEKYTQDGKNYSTSHISAKAILMVQEFCEHVFCLITRH